MGIYIGANPQIFKAHIMLKFQRLKFIAFFLGSVKDLWCRVCWQGPVLQSLDLPRSIFRAGTLFTS